MSKTKVFLNPDLITLFYNLYICENDELKTRLDNLSLNDLFKLCRTLHIIRLLKEGFENNNDYEFLFCIKGDNKND